MKEYDMSIKVCFVYQVCVRAKRYTPKVHNLPEKNITQVSNFTWMERIGFAWSSSNPDDFCCRFKLRETCGIFMRVNKMEKSELNDWVAHPKFGTQSILLYHFSSETSLRRGSTQYLPYFPQFPSQHLLFFGKCWVNLSDSGKYILFTQAC